MREMTAWEFVGGRERTNDESMVRKFEGYTILVGKLRGNMILGPHKDPRKLFPCGEEDGGHKRAEANMRKLGVTRVFLNTNVVVYCMSKAKASAAYNQMATSNIISIVKNGELPDNSKCEAFMEGKIISGRDQSDFHELPIGELNR